MTNESAVLGRDEELATLTSLLASAEHGGGALVLRGPPGIGKTTLLTAATSAATARGMVVLSVHGVPTETLLPFAGLHQLLHPLMRLLGGLPPRQRSALEAAFGLGEATVPDKFLVALATLELLSDTAARSPLLLIGDGAQWIDQPTAEVLAFIARRLTVDPIVVLVAICDGFDDPFKAAGLPELVIGPLDGNAAAVLLDQQCVRLDTPVRSRLLAEAGGNPLALVELPRAITSGAASAALLSGALPLTETLKQAFAARARELPPATQAALLVAAANDGADLAVTLRAATTLDAEIDSPGVFDSAVAAHLIKLDEQSVHFRHPLVRSAVYEAAGAARRRAAHAALADALPLDSDRSVWHRATASVGSDPALADALDAAANRFRQRGAISVALSALERAASLSSDPAISADRLVRAAEIAYELGGPDACSALLSRAEASELSDSERARLTMLHVQSEDPVVWAGGTRVASLVEMSQRVRDAGDIGLALQLLAAVAFMCWWIDLEQPTRDLVTTAAEAFVPTANDATAVAILAFTDPVERAVEVIEAVTRLAAVDGLDPNVSRLLGTSATAVGGFDRSADLLAAAIERLRREGRLGLVAQALVSQAWAATFLGNWSLASTAAAEAGSLARETSQPRFAAAADLAHATIAGLRGDYAAADSLCGDADRVLLILAAPGMRGLANLARGMAALTRGAYDDAYVCLRRLFDPDNPGYHPFVRLWVTGEIAEAAVRSGHCDQARTILAGLEPAARRSGSPFLQLGQAYADAVLADDRHAEAKFRAALAEDVTPWPFHHARLQLAYGSWLRRQRRIGDSRAPLRTSRELFDALGAIPWGDRARHELRASGETSRARTPDLREQLTPQELQIAELAATGLTNREIGEQLYLSHRTISYHLRRIFPKLEISSRVELRAALEHVTPVS